MNPKDQVQGSFPETLQKDILRVRDLALLQKLAERKNRELCYCGMCGIEATDVLRWKEVLDKLIIIERPFKDDASRSSFKTGLVLKLAPLFNGNIQFVFQDVWNFLASPEFTQLASFPDVVNLDFCGGLINEVKMEYPKQRTAFQRLFEEGRKHSEDFILLMTLLPRDQGRLTYKRYLDDVIGSIAKHVAVANRTGVQRQLEASRKFHERSNLTLFKACIPLLLEEIGRSHNCVVRTEYIRLYTKMIHFAFECRFVSGVLGLPSDSTTAIPLLNQPMRKLLVNGTEEQEWPPQITVE